MIKCYIIKVGNIMGKHNHSTQRGLELGDGDI